ncbi:hypothetical protein Hte_009747 [Hypoxylon texense]
MSLRARSLWLVISLFTLKALAACSSYGVDYVNGGSYDVDATSNDNFTFTTIFQGCEPETVKPVLLDPSGNQHPCSAVNTTPDGEQVTSTCWSDQHSSRIKYFCSVLTAISRSKSNSAVATYRTVSKTATVTRAPETITAPCAGITQTVTITPKAPTVTSTYTITRTVTDKKVTSHSTVTVTKTAYCHYSTTKSFTIPDPQPTICIGLSCLPPGHGGGLGVPDTVMKIEKRDVAAVAATTITVTETTYTVTSTSITTVPATTTTEDVYQTVTATITPAPSTVCDDNRPGTTVTITRPFATVTQTDVKYSTTHIEATVWVGETKYETSTNKVSATSCWMNGGSYGADQIMITAKP